MSVIGKEFITDNDQIVEVLDKIRHACYSTSIDKYLVEVKGNLKDDETNLGEVKIINPNMLVSINPNQ